MTRATSGHPVTPILCSQFHSHNTGHPRALLVQHPHYSVSPAVQTHGFVRFLRTNRCCCCYTPSSSWCHQRHSTAGSRSSPAGGPRPFRAGSERSGTTRLACCTTVVVHKELHRNSSDVSRQQGNVTTGTHGEGTTRSSTAVTRPKRRRNRSTVRTEHSAQTAQKTLSEKAQHFFLEHGYTARALCVVFVRY